jgi:hypothetical protein
MLEPDERECDHRVLAPLGGGEVRQQKRELDVLPRRQYRQEVVELEHEADVLRAPARELAARQLVDALAADQDRSRGRGVEAADRD